ncbi:hypothetical protein GCM10022204_01030 [Microlunatus aurantiacus]|uniref:Uncharacterized protein n=1 Tax=Microlunatus aurantiacus TaxID=446786 RepID=A0ABP7CJC2_9ACTN
MAAIPGSPSGVRPATASTAINAYSTLTTMPLASIHHQNSLRLARPEKVAYFWKTRFTAGTKAMPECGQSSGGTWVLIVIGILPLAGVGPPGPRA